MAFGRFLCVAVPFILTLGSLVALLIAGLAGVADKNLYLFEVNTTDLSVSASDVSTLISSRSPDSSDSSSGIFGIFHDPNLLNTTSTIESGGNITAADLGLMNVYEVSLWGFCYVAEDGSTGCSKAEFNWAQDAFDGAEGDFSAISTLSGGSIAVPEAITDALKSFATIVKITEIVFIVAAVALVVELFFGFFAECSRFFSCLTFLVSLVASVAVGAAAALSTATAGIVVGAVEGAAKQYGVTASVNTSFLVCIWIAVLCAIAAGLFWIFTICCCAPDHHRSRARRTRFRDPVQNEGEKLMPIGAYQPLHEPEQQGVVAGNQYSYAPQYAPRYPSGAPASDLAYEPYSHANV